MFRKFGVEIEIFGLSLKKTKSIIDTADFKDWQVVYDHSICGCQTEFCTNNCETAEVVSPILQSEKDLETIEKLCNLLIANGAHVNKTCGFHVHVDARELEAKQIELIYRRYSKYESAIDLLHPKDRRLNKNNYCLSIKPIVEMMNEDKIEFKTKKNIAYKLLIDKYYKLNLTSIENLGSIEFRQHKGSLNFTELKHWIYFCQEFVETSINVGMKDSLFRGINGATKEFYTRILENA